MHEKTAADTRPEVGAGPRRLGLPEVERKYDVDGGLEIPDLGGLSGSAAAGRSTEVELVAVYLDTPSADLARHGVVLRRRTGGSDEGWHLKVRLGGDERREVHHPVGPSEDHPPEALLRLLKGVLRGRQVAPVARLTTLRREHPVSAPNGTVLAVVCDDRVTAAVESATGPHGIRSWREWEIELVDAPDALLDEIEERLLAAGARPAEAGSKLSRVLPARPEPWSMPDEESGGADTIGSLIRGRAGELFHELVESDVRYRLNRPDSVHRLRIAARRLRSLLTTCRPVLGREAVDGLREDLRWLGRGLSGERDAQVLRHHLLEEALPKLSGHPVPGPALTRLRAELDAHQQESHHKARRTVGTPRYLSLLDRLDALLGGTWLIEVGERPAAEEMGRLVIRDAERLRRAMKAAGKASPGEDRGRALHEARKKAKRLRYAAELAEPVVGKPAKRLRRAGKDLQQALGAHQDAVLAAGALRDLAAHTSASQLGFDLGRLYAGEQARASRAERRAGTSWKSVSKELVRWRRKVS